MPYPLNRLAWKQFLFYEEMESWKTRAGVKPRFFSNYMPTFALSVKGSTCKPWSFAHSIMNRASRNIDVNAEKGSQRNVMALMIKEFPGSWLPYAQEMVIQKFRNLF